MSSLIIFVSNLTDRDFDHLDISFRTNEAIVRTVQVTAIPCESVSEDVMSLPLGYNRLFDNRPRFRCDTLPRHTSMEFVLAIVNADPLNDLFRRQPPDASHFKGLIGPE
jgi:hypothetical protein